MTKGQHLIGKVLGDCLLEQSLGYGGSSAVFLAQQRSPDRKVAIKVFLPRSTLDAQVQKDFYARFQLEAESASRLDHPNILPINAYGKEDGLPYIVMPYMPGGTLSNFILQNGCLSLAETHWYLEQIASALDYAHAQNCVHCDVKPANILLDNNGQVMLADFGIAHLMQTDPTSGNFVARVHGMLLGTPDYISPEQALGHPIDGRSDIYSLGILVFYLLTGTVPFKADSTIATALLHVYEPPLPLSQYRIDIPPALDAVMAKSLEKHPEDRYQTAREFSAAFALAIAEHCAPAAKSLRGTPLRRLKRAPATHTHTHNRSRKTRMHPPLTSPKPHRVSLLLRTLALASLLLVVSLGTAVITSRFTNGAFDLHPSATQPASRDSASGATNILAHTDDWPSSSAFFFTGQQYHIQNTSAKYLAVALYVGQQYAQFHLSVTASEIRGSHLDDELYGVIFRSSVDESNYYLFEVLPWKIGQYSFMRFNGTWRTLATGSTPSLITTLGATNTLTIDARGNSFAFSINGTSLGSPITDTLNPLTVGEVGLCLEGQGEVVFSHLSILSTNTP